MASDTDLLPRRLLICASVKTMSKLVHAKGGDLPDDSLNQEKRIPPARMNVFSVYPIPILLDNTTTLDLSPWNSSYGDPMTAIVANKD